MGELTPSEQLELVRALGRSEVLGHAVTRAEIIETHISYVLLTGTYAYKIKKAVDLGFLDFTHIDNRRRFCFEEIRLNRRTAPELYLSVIPIGGSVEHPRLSPDGADIIEYAVRMREFPQADLADNLLIHGQLKADDFERLAEAIAAFHADADVAAADSAFGLPAAIRAPILQNLDELMHLAPEQRPTLDALREWTSAQLHVLEPLFAARKRERFIRECHGDLHLANIARVDGKLAPFDCIEFAPELRWIDVMSDVAFLCMDLDYRGHADFAARFLNRYLELTGDYAGIQVLPFYRAYRALVRAKVVLLKLLQHHREPAQSEQFRSDYLAYVRLAQRYTLRRKSTLLITHGLSGSGKTTFTGSLLARLGAIRVRSDVERKRLHGLAALESSYSSVGGELYSARTSGETYEHLLRLAGILLGAGERVIVDATFLRRAQRDAFQALARERGADFVLLDFWVPVDELRRRIAQRQQIGADASEATGAVLDSQLKTQEPLTVGEQDHVISIDSCDARAQDAIGLALAKRLECGHNLI